MNEIGVVVADDIESHRLRVQRAVEQRVGFRFLGASDSGTKAVELVKQVEPNVILLDIEMEEKFAGINAARRIHESYPNVRIIMLTVHDEDGAVVAAFQTGVMDYLLKTADDETIVAAIRMVYENRPPIRPLIVEKIRSELDRTRKEADDARQMEERLMYTLKLISDLTPSEIEVLRLLYGGKKRYEIAEERFVSLGTIKAQINSILKKCAFRTSKELVSLLKHYRVFEILDRI
jgi:DNA-binding NarL/FixJ family response regulator